MACCAWNLIYLVLLCKITKCNSLRPLLPSKALVDNLGIAVYAEVFCCCSIGGCCCRIALSSSSTSQGSSRAVPEDLHCCKEQEVLQYPSHEEHTSNGEQLKFTRPFSASFGAGYV